LEGLTSTKRITDRVNEAERRAENLATCKALETRVQDWKGHHIANFGQLRLDDLFSVNKSDVDRDYHVFLFEKIILCCKEAPMAPQTNSRKVGKSNSLLKKTATTPQPPPLLGASAKKKTTPLLLKGRIFLSNVTRAISGYKDGPLPPVLLLV
jgi:cell division control protein 24